MRCHGCSASAKCAFYSGLGAPSAGGGWPPSCTRCGGNDNFEEHVIPPHRAPLDIPPERRRSQVSSYSQSPHSGHQWEDSHLQWLKVSTVIRTATCMKLYSLLKGLIFKEIPGKPKSKPKIMDKTLVHVVLLWRCEGSRGEKGDVLVQVLRSQQNWLQEQASLLWTLLK